jgi:4-deoxy-L-threo-5-hexosulose-uronate ketol-isomerase
MNVRNPISPNEAKCFGTEQLRKAFLIEDLFIPGEVSITYSHFDRIISGGAIPTDKPLELSGGKEIGAESFLERRELGIINIGSAGAVTIDGTKYTMDTRDGLYVGMGAAEIKMESADRNNPAKFYLVSAPAHKSYPTKKVSLSDARQVHLGDRSESNVRTIYQYIHPDVLESCQLLMGMTLLAEENVWNTMPVHTHDRRMEVYLYFDLPDDAVVFHYMGTPDETRHIVVRNEQAVISPSWSIHSGVGTKNYTFIWGMVGENQTFTDMDHIPMDALK